MTDDEKFEQFKREVRMIADIEINKRWGVISYVQKRYKASENKNATKELSSVLEWAFKDCEYPHQIIRMRIEFGDFKKNKFSYSYDVAKDAYYNHTIMSDEDYDKKIHDQYLRKCKKLNIDPSLKGKTFVDKDGKKAIFLGFSKRIKFPYKFRFIEDNTVYNVNKKYFDEFLKGEIKDA